MKMQNKRTQKNAYPYVTREDIRELDRISIEEYKIPGILLMENAGAGAASIIAQKIQKGPVIILCGPGNNGGDGFVIARHLYNKGIQVEVFFVGEMDKIQPTSDPGINLAILKKMGLTPIQILNPQGLEAILLKNSPEIFVDALLGTGLSGPVREPIAGVIRKVASWNIPVIAVDIPSGMDANTGEILGTALPARETITFALPKKGFLLEKGPQLTGEVVVVEISIPRNLLEKKWSQ